MSEGADYIAHGWALCQFDAGTKGGESAGKGWNTSERAIRDPRTLRQGQNIGLLHAWSGTAAIDVDKHDEALAWLEARGVNLEHLLAADDAVQIKSGRPNKGKLLYAVPPGIDPLSLPSVSIRAIEPDAEGKFPVILEFRCATRCGTKTLQDVLPPSIHPDTGKPYEWGGDWRALPDLPEALLAIWREHIEPAQERKARGATGPGTSAEVMDMVRRLEAAGLKPYRCGDGFRGYCPVHGGESGTTLKIDEAADGRVLVHCHAKCTPEAIFKALPARDRGIPTIASFEQLKRAQDARKAGEDMQGGASLPEFPAELLALPHGLGRLQDWILGYMRYPSAAAAGITALATLAHFAMAHVVVDSDDGLGLNEQFLLLAPTGFGKEDLRKPFAKLADALSARPRPANAGNLWPAHLPHLQYSAPASQQGLHQLLEKHQAQTFLSDEFAEWLSHAASDSHKQQALGHFMQAYSKATSTIAAPAAVTKEYKPVNSPRILIFATSTAERLLETVTASHADSGAINRFVILVAEQDRIAKRYAPYGEDQGAKYQPPAAVVDLVEWVAALSETTVRLDPDAYALYVAHDAAVLDPLKFADYRLAGRLNEQALKMAALVALSDRRTLIDVRDLAIAYAIREGLYRRAASMFGIDGALSGMHNTGRALEQIRLHLVAKPFVYRSNLAKVSRKFAALSVPEREAVLRAVQTEGFAKLDGGRLVSLICEGGTP